MMQLLGASDSHSNFKEGDTVTVERSTDGSYLGNTTVEGDSSDSSFRILHKYLLQKMTELSYQTFIRSNSRFRCSKWITCKNIFKIKEKVRSILLAHENF